MEAEFATAAEYKGAPEQQKTSLRNQWKRRMAKGSKILALTPDPQLCTYTILCLQLDTCKSGKVSSLENQDRAIKLSAVMKKAKLITKVRSFTD